MSNADRTNLIRIYGITIGEGCPRPYGHGREKFDFGKGEVWVDYADYFISDLVALIDKQNLKDKFIKDLKEVKT